ncbi:hypothetical protein BSKO_07899 [Bryopsis sp. KO-2023]|nr:hypothetical protein BSKO_07899 [Bryopsis sp. KO-2023]
MAEADFSTGFSFDLGGEQRQAAWELTSAIRDADLPSIGTSVDFKINRRLKKQGGQSGQKRKLELESESEFEPETPRLQEENAKRSKGKQTNKKGAIDIESQDEEIVESEPESDVENLEALTKSGQDDQSQNAQPSKRKRSATSGSEYFDRAPASTRYKAYSFTDLNLSRPLVKACDALGYETPTPIQAACIPLALAGRDICGSAITGSGKTAAFSLPLLERLLYRPKRVQAIYVLILTPTRELAVQVHSMIQTLAKFTDIRVALVVGGLSLSAQASTLRAQPEIVVATPGRMIDHLRNSQSVGLEELQALVFDEADKLLQLGFKDEMEQIIRATPRKRQTMLFSATMTTGVQALMALSLKNPVRLAADPSGKVPKKLIQEITRLKGANAEKKEALVLALCARTFQEKTIVFCKTKSQAHRLKLLFGLLKLPPAGELHGNMAQAARLDSLEKFRKGEYAFLLATDVAGRGLDILGVEVVINMDAPRDLDTYLHRIGRTARAGANGRSVTFITDDNRKLVKEIMKKTGSQLANRAVPPKVVAKFEKQVSDIGPDIDIILGQENEERGIRRAEMDAARAENMLEHGKEILARPKRTWFQGEKEKRELAKLCKAQADGELDELDLSSLNVEARRAPKESGVQKGTKQKKESKQVSETKHLMGGITAIKKKERELRSQGMSARAAEQLIAAETAPKKKKKKAKKNSEEGDGAADGLFEGDGNEKALKNAKVYPGGGTSGRLQKDPVRTASELAKLKRGGKGRHAFKGRKRYKRK